MFIFAMHNHGLSGFNEIHSPKSSLVVDTI